MIGTVSATIGGPRKEETCPFVGTLKTKTPVVDLGSRKVGVDAAFDLAVATR